MVRDDRRRHLDRKRFDAAAGGGREEVELAIDVVAHLEDEVCGCPECRLALEEYPRGAVASRASGVSAAGFRASFHGAVDIVERIDRETLEAVELLSELRSSESVGQMEDHLLSNPRYTTMGMGIVLLEYAEIARQGYGHESLALAEVAVFIGESLSADGPGGTRLVEDFRAQARIGLAAGYRVVGNLEEAEAELHRAQAAMRRGSENLAIAGMLGLERCRIHLARGQWDEALKQVEKVRRWLRRLDDDQLRWEALLIEAKARRMGGEVLWAITSLKAMVAIIRAEGGSLEIETRARLDLVAALYAGGELEKARDEIAALRILEVAGGDAALEARVAWWSGLIEMERGESVQAIDDLEIAWRGLAAVGAGLEAIGAGLMLASVLLEEARYEQLGELGSSLPDLLMAEGVPDWAVAMLLAALGGIWQRDGAGLGEAAGLVLRAAELGWSGGAPPARH